MRGRGVFAAAAMLAATTFGIGIASAAAPTQAVLPRSSSKAERVTRRQTLTSGGDWGPRRYRSKNPAEFVAPKAGVESDVAEVLHISRRVRRRHRRQR